MKNKLIILLILILSLTMTTSCSLKNGNKKNIVTTTLVKDTTLSELNDSSFIPRQVMCMSIFGEDLYYSDYFGEIVVLDKDYNVKKRIGSRGQGPGELLSVAHFYIAGGDSIYIRSDGRQAIDLFVHGKYTLHIPFPKETRLDNTRFFSEDQHIFHTVVSDSFPVIVFDHDSKINQFICNRTAWDKPDLKLHSTRHLLKGDDVFFVIGYVLPVFQVYSMDGKLLKEYDLRLIPEIDRKVKLYENTPPIPNSYQILIEDVYFDNHKIYLLIGTKEDSYFCNTICVLDVSGEIMHTSTFRLSGEAYISFCVKGNKLVAFNGKNASLDFFTLP